MSDLRELGLPEFLEFVLCGDWVLWDDGLELQLSEVISVYPTLARLRVFAMGTGRDVDYSRILDVVQGELVFEDDDG